MQKMTASVEAQHNPLSPPMGGEGLLLFLLRFMQLRKIHLGVPVNCRTCHASESVISIPQYDFISDNYDSKMIRLQRKYLPYGLRELQDGQWELFDRDYKTIGQPFTFARKPSRATLQALSALDINTESEIRAVWFYDDGCEPTRKDEHWAAYSALLQRLACLGIKPD